MWERFTERAKLAVNHARDEAVQLNSEMVRTEHIFLGLLAEPEGMAARALANLGEDISELANVVRQRCERGLSSVPRLELTFAPRAKNVLELSVEFARRFNHSYIGTEHILQGVVAQTDGISAQIFQERSIGLQSVQAEVIRLLGDSNTRSKLQDRQSEDSLPMSPNAVSLIAAAEAIARKYGRQQINSEHILLALVDEEGGNAAKLLEAASVNLDKVKPEIVRLMGDNERVD